MEACQAVFLSDSLVARAISLKFDHFYVFLFQTLGGAGDDEMQEEDMDEDLNVDDEVNIEEMLDEELPVSVNSLQHCSYNTYSKCSLNGHK